MSVTERPTAGPVQDWQFPTPETLQLSNGITVALHHQPGQYIVALRLAIPVQLADEPREREGVATAMARLLDEGTSTRDSHEFNIELERKGIAIGLGAGAGAIQLDLNVPQRFLSDALALGVEMVSDPIFAQREVDRILRSRLAEIEQERASAARRAFTELAATFFAPTERASRPRGGTAETVAAITRDDIVAFHRRSMGPQGAVLVLAGDFGELDMRAELDATFGQWRNDDHVPAPAPTLAESATDRVRVVVVDRPGSVQSEFAIACPGPDRQVGGDGRDWAAYPVVGYVIGGSPNARIDAVLREDKGYTYGIRSGFRPRRRGGLFLTTGSVRSEVTVESLGLLLEILDKARDGFEAQELADGVDFIVRTAPGRLATSEEVADETLMRLLDGLPDTFTSANLERMRELTPERARQAYTEFVDGRWTVVIVGDAAGFADALTAAGYDVTVVPN